jgi:hypothetical protein
MTPTYTPDGRPVFGRGADHTTTSDFAIEVYDTVTSEAEDIQFSALADIGSGPFIGYLRAARAGGDAQVQGAAGLLLRVMIDTDGLPSTYEADRLKQLMELHESLRQEGVPEADLPGDLDEPDDERLADVTAWSSKRKFEHYVDSERHHIGKEALTELAAWVARQAAGRPTKGTTDGASSSASPSGPTRTPRGSRASRSKRA